MRRAQMQLSFTMIFSIILIIMTIAVAFYAISQFLKTSDCLKIRLYYEDLERESDRVWRSASANLELRLPLPNSVQSVCFGNVALLDARQYPVESKALSGTAAPDKNAYIYPRAVCESSLASRGISHISVPSPFCASVADGKITVHLKKTSSEGLVTLMP